MRSARTNPTAPTRRSDSTTTTRKRSRRAGVALAASLSLATVVAGGATAFAVQPSAAEVADVGALAEDTLQQAESKLDAAHDEVDTDELETLIVRVEGYEDLSAAVAHDLVGELAVESADVWADTEAAFAVDAEQERLAELATDAAAAWSATLKEQRAAADKIAAKKAAAEAVAQAKTVDGAKAVARAMAADTYGWGDGEFSCLESLWTKESGWNYQAANPSSGAYGIPQSLPGSKMASAGDDWETNAVTQIAWGLTYISDVYGAPCAAWGHSQATNWY